MATRLEITHGLIAERDRLSTSGDTLSVNHPTTGSKTRTKGVLFLAVGTSVPRPSFARRHRARGRDHPPRVLLRRIGGRAGLPREGHPQRRPSPARQSRGRRPAAGVDRRGRRGHPQQRGLSRHRRAGGGLSRCAPRACSCRSAAPAAGCLSRTRAPSRSGAASSAWATPSCSSHGTSPRPSAARSSRAPS